MSITLKVLLINLAIDAAIAVCVFAARNWLKARIERSVQFRFDAKLETIRSELRNAEEMFKKTLREQETALSLLRTNVLSGISRRVEEKNRRRFDAAEKILMQVNNLASFAGIAAMMATVNVEELLDWSKIEPSKSSEFMKTILSTGPSEFSKSALYGFEQLHVSELSWAYYQAYSTIITFSYMQAKIIQINPLHAKNMMNTKHIKELMLKTLPHMSDFIDKYPPNVYYHLIDNIKDLLLAELRKDLDGAVADQQNLAQAKAIMEAAKTLAESQTPSSDLKS